MRSFYWVMLFVLCWGCGSSTDEAGAVDATAEVVADTMGPGDADPGSDVAQDSAPDSTVEIAPEVVITPQDIAEMKFGKFFKWTNIKGSQRASGNADRLQPLPQSLYAKVALLHLAILFLSKRRGPVRAGFRTELTLVLSQAGGPVDNHDSVFFSLCDCLGRAGFNTSGLGAMITARHQKRDL